MILIADAVNVAEMTEYSMSECNLEELITKASDILWADYGCPLVIDSEQENKIIFSYKDAGENPMTVRKTVIEDAQGEYLVEFDDGGLRVIVTPHPHAIARLIYT